MGNRATHRFTRRGFLTLLTAGTAACRRPEIPAAPHEDLSSGCYHWSGVGFGIDMSMEIYGVSESSGGKLGIECEAIIQELEGAFSLYREDSELSILNRERKLEHPSEGFRELIRLAEDCVQRTLGYFQPTVHGAWQWLEKHGDIEDVRNHPEWLRQCAAVDFNHLVVGNDGSIRLSHPLTQLSMNAIVQGHLADLVAARLRSAGVQSALLHLGESLAIGNHPEGRMWKLAVMGTPVRGEVDLVGNIEFANAGLAVSAHDASRRLINPVSASPCREARVAAVVSGEGAAVADAHATAFAVAPSDRWNDLAASLNRKSDRQVHLWRDNELVYQRH